MQVAFIDLSHINAPMSLTILAAAHDLVVHDVRRNTASGLVADNAT